MPGPKGHMPRFVANGGVGQERTSISSPVLAANRAHACQVLPATPRRRFFRGLTRGFTLIEILIVVVILGIIAAIVLPDLRSATTQGNRNTLLAITQTLRTQIAFYKLQHGDVLPDLTANSGNNWALLTQPSVFAGQTQGPYIQVVPINCVNGMTTVLNGNGAAPASSSCGYVYDFNSGAGSGNIWGTDTDGRTLVTK